MSGIRTSSRSGISFDLSRNVSFIQSASYVCWRTEKCGELEESRMQGYNFLRASPCAIRTFQEIHHDDHE
jgi:hypothetical protein